MRGIILLLNMLVLMGLMQSCFEPEGEVEELSFQKVGDGMDPADAFAATVHPILVGKCASCHGDGGTQVKHSASNAADAYAVVNSRSMISLDNPSGSSIVSKVRNGHNCWTNCESNADELQTAVENMKNMVASQGGKIFDRVASAAVFKTTVHPLLLGKCAGCHGDPGSQAPRHAVSDFRKAHDAVIDSARVDFGNIPNSRLVKRLSEDEHYCWGDCAENAAEMQNLIEQWASQIDTTPLTGVDGFKTANLSISDAEIRLPETINGTIVFQAEDAVLEGRYKVKSDSGASGLKYVSGDRPPTHPIEGTQRNPIFAGPSGGNSNNCRTVTPDQVSGGTNGRYRLTETKRHINQSGYRYYNQLIRGRIIRPQLRAQFLAALEAGETNLDAYFLARGGPQNAGNPNGPLNGTQYIEQHYRILPEFTPKSEYDANIKDAVAGSGYEDFFAPRFGASGTEFYSADNSTIRDKMLDDIRRREVYDDVFNRFQEFFYDNNGANPEDNIFSIPFTLRTLPNGTQFQVNNATSAANFMAEYFGDLTTTNAATVVGTDPNGKPIKKIDTYIYYYIDTADRGFNDFAVRYRSTGGTPSQEIYDFPISDVQLDLNNFFSGGDALDDRTITINNYGAIVKPIFAANCIQCHGDGSGRPQFAHNNDTIAYDAGAAINNFINFTNPSQARPMVRMFQERHNCGSDSACDVIGNALVTAYGQWDTQNQIDIANAANSQDTGLIALSEQEKTPGRAKFEFKVTEAGDYNVWLKVKTLAADQRDFRMRILDDQGRPLKNCAQSQNCVPVEADYTNKSAAAIDAMGCEEYDAGGNDEWTWYTENRNNPNNRRKWMLAEGNYTLEIIEDEADAKFDLVAISKNPDFNPAENLIDEGFISSRRPKILSYNLQELLGQPGIFEIEVKEQGEGDAYLFKNPRFRGASQNIMFRDIKLLMNNSYKFENSTYTKLDRIVNGADSGVLTSASLMALQVFGSSTDSFAFVFKALAPTDEPAQAIEDDSPVPVEGRQCQNLTLFANTVMPVLNNFKLIMKDDYIDYTENEFPGRNGQTAGNPTLYNCTTCHNEDHPYFKMTTFADGLNPGDPIPQDGLEELCAQALSRVDFGNYEASLLLRGLNGTFNHPKLHFIQQVGFTGSGNNRQFNTSTTDPSGYASDFIGLRFQKWDAPGQPDDNRYRRVTYNRYNDPFALYDGEVIADGDTVDGNGELVRNGGRSQYSLAGSGNTNGAFKVKDNCIEVDFVNNNGIITDPCNNNVNVDTEFEQLKQTYRESIINWMNEEKKSYDALNGI